MPGKLTSKDHTYIQSLRAAFKNPSSPFYIPPGETGPASPDEPPKSFESIHSAKQGCEPGEQSMSMEEAAGAAREALISMGYDGNSFWEQNISWGHHDAFRQVHPSGILTFLLTVPLRHVNNAHYRKNYCHYEKWVLTITSISD